MGTKTWHSEVSSYIYISRELQDGMYRVMIGPNGYQRKAENNLTVDHTPLPRVQELSSFILHLWNSLSSTLIDFTPILYGIITIPEYHEVARWQQRSFIPIYTKKIELFKYKYIAFFGKNARHIQDSVNPWTFLNSSDIIQR